MAQRQQPMARDQLVSASSITPNPRIRPPTVTINDLPQEMLLRIANEFHLVRGGQNTLWSLCLVKQFYPAASEVLYHRVELTKYYPKAWGILYTVLENPKLAALLQTLLIESPETPMSFAQMTHMTSTIKRRGLSEKIPDEYLWQISRPQSSYEARAALILLHCPRLQVILLRGEGKIQTPPQGDWIHYWATAFTGPSETSLRVLRPSWDTLKTLDVVEHDLSVKDIIPLFHLKSLTALHLGDLQEVAHKQDWSWKPEDLQRPKPSITELAIEGGKVSCAVICSLISACSFLEHASFHTELYEEENAEADLGNADLTPALKALHPSRNSLERLRLTYSGSPTYRNATTVTDELSKFTSLSELKISANLIFPSQQPWTRLMTKLPKTIQNLAIRGVWSKLQADLMKDDGPLLEIIGAPADFLPQLRKIQVKQECQSPTDRLQEEFLKRGISYRFKSLKWLRGLEVLEWLDTLYQ